MDEVDAANNNILLTTEAAIRTIGSSKPEAEATGECLYCTEELAGSKRWCDADCRDGWEKEKRRGK